VNLFRFVYLTTKCSDKEAADIC